jgi:hypothetical protein
MKILHFLILLLIARRLHINLILFTIITKPTAICGGLGNISKFLGGQEVLNKTTVVEPKKEEKK